MKYLLLLSILIIGCSSPSSPDFNKNFETHIGYIANETGNPVLFNTDSDSLFFIYEYNSFDDYKVRVNREVVIEKRDGKNYFVAELGYR